MRPGNFRGLSRNAAYGALLAALLPALLAGCSREEEKSEVAVRPVRSVKVERRTGGVPVALTGRIEAEDEVSLAFRISGRMIKMDVNVGDRVETGQVVAQLDPVNEQNALRAAQANLAAMQGQLVQARNHFERQDTLLKQGWTTRANHDQASQALQTAESAVEAAQAQLETAQDHVGFTELKADAPGVITAIGPRAGTVVQVGQMIARVARADGRDAVFDVSAQLIRITPSDPIVNVQLSEDAKITATGRVREVAPQADPVTRTFAVRVGLTNPPQAMRLGATVIGQLEIPGSAVFELPASALTREGQEPAVWIVDPKTSTVSLRHVSVVRFDQNQVSVSQGLENGDVIVTAGVQALHPGQQVRLLGTNP